MPFIPKYRGVLTRGVSTEGVLIKGVFDWVRSGKGRLERIEGILTWGVLLVYPVFTRNNHI